jgi:hypothetical protein
MAHFLKETFFGLFFPLKKGLKTAFLFEMLLMLGVTSYKINEISAFIHLLRQEFIKP